MRGSAGARRDPAEDQVDGLVDRRPAGLVLHHAVGPRNPRAVGDVEEQAGGFEHIDVLREIVLHAPALEDLHQESDRAVVELEHPARDPGLGLGCGPQRDRRQVPVGDEELVLNIQEIAQTIGRGTISVIGRAEAGPRLLLQLEEPSISSSSLLCTWR